MAVIASEVGATKGSHILRTKILGRSRIMILCYHRITETNGIMGPQCVSPRNFENHVRHFHSVCDVWPLVKISDFLEGRCKPKRDTVILTFDDGYMDNYEEALPILNRYGIPATFFVTTGPILTGRPHWIDVLASVLDRIASGYDGSRFDMGAHMAVQFARFRQSKQRRQREIGIEILDHLKSLKEDVRNQIVTTLYSRYEISDRTTVTDGRRMMSVEQILSLVAQGHEVGAHSVSHPMLAQLDEKRCREEIHNSINCLESIGVPVSSFAYPFGGEDDIGEATTRILGETAVRIGVTTERRKLRMDDNPLRVPRMVVSDTELPRLVAGIERHSW